MRRQVLKAILAAVIVAAQVGLLSSCSSSSAAPRQRTAIVTTAMLEHVAEELLAGVDDVRIVRLLPPGSCPGHFDLPPSTLPALKSADVILRHDFQGVLDGKIAQITGDAGKSVAVSSHGSLLVPEHFVRLVDETAAALIAAFPRSSARVDANRQALQERVRELSEAMSAQPRPWQGAAAIASLHQKAFAEWLGLNVVATLQRPEDVRPRQLEELMQVDAQIVIGNLQEGPRAAQTLGTRKGLPVAVFSNFPRVEDYGAGYVELIRNNVARLEAAWAKR